MTRKKLRVLIPFISLLLFPITLNFFSPYVSIDGAFNGIISGSVIVFILLFLSGLFFRRAWCAYGCPVASISEFSEKINSKNVNRFRLRKLRYLIFALWFTTLVSGFIVAGGFKGIDPFHLTENGISVDMPLKYITYYLVLGSLTALSLLIGKRGACQSVCWMSPFMVAGAWVGDRLNLSQWKIVSDSEKCITCHQCDKACPMSISVMKDQKDGWIKTQDCILCGQCVDVCPKKVLTIQCQKRRHS